MAPKRISGFLLFYLGAIFSLHLLTNASPRTTSQFRGVIDMENCTGSRDFSRAACPVPLRDGSASSAEFGSLLQIWRNDPEFMFCNSGLVNTTYGLVNRTIFTVRQQCNKHTDGNYRCTLYDNICPMYVYLYLNIVKNARLGPLWSLYANGEDGPIHRSYKVFNNRIQLFATGSTKPDSFQISCFPKGTKCLRDALEVSAIMYSCSNDISR